MGFAGNFELLGGCGCFRMMTTLADFHAGSLGGGSSPKQCCCCSRTQANRVCKHRQPAVLEKLNNSHHLHFHHHGHMNITRTDMRRKPEVLDCFLLPAMSKPLILTSEHPDFRAVFTVLSNCSNKVCYQVLQTPMSPGEHPGPELPAKSIKSNPSLQGPLRQIQKLPSRQ